jgi:hypothetical protein
MIRIYIFTAISWVLIILFGYASSYRPSFPEVLPSPVSTMPVSSAVSTDNSDFDVDVMLMTMPAVIATM